MYPPPPDATSVPAAKPKKSTSFSPAVREYVQRCFDSKYHIPSVTTEEMQIRLKQLINQAAAEGGLDSVDWSTMPLPQNMIIEERKAPKVAPVSTLPENMSDMKRTNGGPYPTNPPIAKKRKSSEMIEDSHAQQEDAPPPPLPPWRKSNVSNVLEDRVSFPPKSPGPQSTKKQKRAGKAFAVDTSHTVTDLEKRRQRFNLNSSGGNSPMLDVSRSHSPTPAAIQGPVIGTCQVLEKRYFRLTSAPKPETVRPQPVLEKALDMLKKKWKQEGGNNYSYICDQFKSMRQDLTVQHIKNAFTVNVYETHAHIALQKKDLGEYNQCQTQLRALYKQKLPGRAAEFLAYRILYFIYTGNRTDMNDALASITPADRRVSAVKHALDVRSALALGNYHRFFRLYLDAPNMGPYLMDIFIARERLSALAKISKA